MKTPLTIWDATNLLAEKSGIALDQVKAVLQAQAELAYQYADSGYPIAGIGILNKLERPARRLMMRFGPRTGQEAILPAKQVLKLRIAPIAKEVVFGRGTVPEDVTNVELNYDIEPGDERE